MVVDLRVVVLDAAALQERVGRLGELARGRRARANFIDVALARLGQRNRKRERKEFLLLVGQPGKAHADLRQIAQRHVQVFVAKHVVVVVAHALDVRSHVVVQRLDHLAAQKDRQHVPAVRQRHDLCVLVDAMRGRPRRRAGLGVDAAALAAGVGHVLLHAVQVAVVRLVLLHLRRLGAPRVLLGLLLLHLVLRAPEVLREGLGVHVHVAQVRPIVVGVRRRRALLWLFGAVLLLRLLRLVARLIDLLQQSFLLRPHAGAGCAKRLWHHGVLAAGDAGHV